VTVAQPRVGDQTRAQHTTEAEGRTRPMPTPGPPSGNDSTAATSHAERIVDSAGVKIATRDYGGDGPPVVLIHGLGRTLEDWSLLAPHLAARHRVVALDLRCHGRSDDGPWAWHDILGDVKAVVTAYGLTSPVPVGHSLGGRVAALYAEADPRCLAAVDLDGHDRAPVDLGLDPDYVQEQWSRIRELNVTELPGGGEVIREDDLRPVMGSSLDTWEQLDIPRGIQAASLERSLHRAPGGDLQFRPSRAIAERIVAASFALPLSDCFRRIRCPLLVYNAVGSDRHDEAFGISELNAFLRAWRSGLARHLSTFALECPHMTIETITTSHFGLVTRCAESVASRIGEFIAGAASTRGHRCR
jgi:pimeloyl-ACP methyl ester carboxylesterase